MPIFFEHWHCLRMSILFEHWSVFECGLSEITGNTFNSVRGTMHHKIILLLQHCLSLPIVQCRLAWITSLRILFSIFQCHWRSPTSEGLVNFLSSMAAKNGLATLRQIVKHCTTEVKGFDNVLDKVGLRVLNTK